MLSQAGPSLGLDPAGHWLATLGEQEQREALEEDPDMARLWHERWGDRRTELVMIGIEMDVVATTKALDDCLLSVTEMDAEWSDFYDPLPEFADAEDSDEADSLSPHSVSPH